MATFAVIEVKAPVDITRFGSIPVSTYGATLATFPTQAEALADAKKREGYNKPRVVVVQTA